jgi:hypothetical protein
MNIGRGEFANVKLHDGRVLVIGGTTQDGIQRLTEVGRYFRRENQLRVLVPGGHSAPHAETNTADLFNPETRTWAPAGLMNAARAGHAAIVLRGNRGVLVMGGLTSHSAATDSVDIFQVAPLP